MQRKEKDSLRQCKKWQVISDFTHAFQVCILICTHAYIWVEDGEGLEAIQVSFNLILGQGSDTQIWTSEAFGEKDLPTSKENIALTSGGVLVDPQVFAFINFKN